MPEHDNNYDDENYEFFFKGFDEKVAKSMTTTASESSLKERVKFPITYAGQEGTYIFRIYPDNYKGKPRFFRMLTINQLPNNKKVFKPMNENRIDKLITEANEKGIDNFTSGLWKNKWKTEAVMMVYLISAPDGKYVQPSGSASALILNYKQLEAINLYFKGLEKNEGVDIMDFLNPLEPRNAIKLTITKQRNGKKEETIIGVSGTTSSDYELPPMKEVLPEGITFEGLEETYVKPDQLLTEDEFEDFKTYLNEVIREYNTKKEKETFDPNSSEAEKGYKVQFDDEGK